MRPLAEAVADEFVVVAQATGHRIEVEGDAEALGDELRVLQIVRILVENAIRHTPPGTSVRIVLGSDAGRASLAVEDEGGGIAAERRGSGLRALLPHRGQPGLRQRARARDRAASWPR